MRIDVVEFTDSTYSCSELFCYYFKVKTLQHEPKSCEEAHLGVQHDLRCSVPTGGYVLC